MVSKTPKLINVIWYYAEEKKKLGTRGLSKRGFHIEYSATGFLM